MLKLLKKLKREHDLVNFYDFEDYYLFDDLTDLHLIATSNDIPDGVFIHSRFPKEIFIKKYDENGRILIGFSSELSSERTMYRATNDGLAYKDEDTLVSISESEKFLVMADDYGYDYFVLVETTCDEHINLVDWYGNHKDFPEKDFNKKLNIVSNEPKPKTKRKYNRKKGK